LSPAEARPVRPARRTQEQRSAETRARVVAAAGECVVELGFRGATMTAIAERAGVTWGAMQHQFGDKDAILDAVLEDALGVLEERIADVGDAPTDVALRVRRFASRAAEMLRDRRYRAFLEIQLNRSRSAEHGAEWDRHVAGVLSSSWNAAFGDLGLARRSLNEARGFAFMALAGIAIERMLFPRADRSRAHLATLCEALTRMLAFPESRR